MQYYHISISITFYSSVSQAVSKKATKPLATPSSVQTSAALLLVSTALVCTLSYCRFNLCISGRVTLRIGRWRSNVLSAAGGEGIGKVEAVGIAERWVRRDEVIVDVVFVSVWRAFGGGFERWGSASGIHVRPAEDLLEE
jgi:hypothetical protein